MSGQTKIELLLEFKDRATTGITKARETINSRVKEMKEDLSAFKGHFASSFNSVKSEVPSFNKSFKNIKIPYETIKQGAIKVVSALKDMLDFAGKFESDFLKIQNINMDKPAKSMLTYEKIIKDTSMALGMDLGEIVNAFYKVQVNTGLFGKSAENIVNPVTKFSRVMGTDLSANIDLTTKSMKAFELKSKDTNALMKSNYTAIKMTGLSYSELAKEQATFAKATTNSGQSINTINKLFTGFKAVAGDATTASKMTQAAFSGLKDPSVQKGLENMGIELKDGNGQLRDYGSIIQDVVKEFKGMTPEGIQKAISKIGGTGGLSELFVKLNKSSEDFNKTINEFDASKFNMDEAFARAMGSYNVLKEIVGNRFNTLMSTLGKGILPIVSGALESINNGLLWVYNNIGLVKDFITMTTWAVGAWALAWVALNAQFVFSQIAIGGMTVAFKALSLIMQANPFAIAIGLIVGLLVYAYKKSETFRAIIDGLWTSMKAFGLYIKDSFVGIFMGAWAGIKGFFGNIWSGVKNLVGGIADAFGGIGKIIKSVFTFNWDGVKEGVSDLKGGLKRAGGGLLDAVPLTSVVKNYKQLGDAAKDGFNEGVKNRKDVNLKNEFNKGHLNSLLESKGLLKADGSRDMAQIEKLNLLKTGKKIDEEKLKAYKQPEEKEKKETEKTLIPDTTQLQTGSSEKATVPASFIGIGTTSAATKSVSIHVDSFVKGGINMLNGEGDGLSLNEIEDRFNEMFTRMLRRVETAQ